MSSKNFAISYYKNADAGMHIQKIRSSQEAKKEHSHDYFQIYYIVRGGMYHVTGNDSSALTKGDVFLIPPGKTHYIKDLSDTLFYTFSFTYESITKSNNASSLVVHFLENVKDGQDTKAKITLDGENAILIESLMEKMYREFTGKQIGCSEVVLAYATVMLTTLARAYYENAELTIPKLTDRTRIMYCIEYIDNNFNKDISLSDIVKWAAMSKSEFCKQFREASGTSFKKYLHNKRITHAISLIEKGHKISAIYAECGYNDFTTFFRNFKSLCGCSPEQYKSKSSRIISNQTKQTKYK